MIENPANLFSRQSPTPHIVISPTLRTASPQISTQRSPSIPLLSPTIATRGAHGSSLFPPSKASSLEDSSGFYVDPLDAVAHFTRSQDSMQKKGFVHYMAQDYAVMSDDSTFYQRVHDIFVKVYREAERLYGNGDGKKADLLLVDSRTMNAFAYRGEGMVVVSLELLRMMEKSRIFSKHHIAALLAHECRHLFQKGGLSIEDEIEADWDGNAIVSAAGFNPLAYVDLSDFLYGLNANDAGISFFKSHPKGLQRLALNIAANAKPRPGQMPAEHPLDQPFEHHVPLSSKAHFQKKLRETTHFEESCFQKLIADASTYEDLAMVADRLQDTLIGELAGKIYGHFDWLTSLEILSKDINGDPYVDNLLTPLFDAGRDEKGTRKAKNDYQELSHLFQAINDLFPGVPTNVSFRGQERDWKMILGRLNDAKTYWPLLQTRYAFLFPCPVDSLSDKQKIEILFRLTWISCAKATLDATQAHWAILKEDNATPLPTLGTIEVRIYESGESSSFSLDLEKEIASSYIRRQKIHQALTDRYRQLLQQEGVVDRQKQDIYISFSLGSAASPDSWALNRHYAQMKDLSAHMAGIVHEQVRMPETSYCLNGPFSFVGLSLHKNKMREDASRLFEKAKDTSFKKVTSISQGVKIASEKILGHRISRIRDDDPLSSYDRIKRLLSADPSKGRHAYREIIQETMTLIKTVDDVDEFVAAIGKLPLDERKEMIETASAHWNSGLVLSDGTSAVEALEEKASSLLDEDPSLYFLWIRGLMWSKPYPTKVASRLSQIARSLTRSAEAYRRKEIDLEKLLEEVSSLSQLLKTLAVAIPVEVLCQDPLLALAFPSNWPHHEWPKPALKPYTVNAAWVEARAKAAFGNLFQELDHIFSKANRHSKSFPPYFHDIEEKEPFLHFLAPFVASIPEDKKFSSLEEALAFFWENSLLPLSQEHIRMTLKLLIHEDDSRGYEYIEGMHQGLCLQMERKLSFLLGRSPTSEERRAFVKGDAHFSSVLPGLELLSKLLLGDRKGRLRYQVDHSESPISMTDPDEARRLIHPDYQAERRLTLNQSGSIEEKLSYTHAALTVALNWYRDRTHSLAEDIPTLEAQLTPIARLLEPISYLEFHSPYDRPFILEKTEEGGVVIKENIDKETASKSEGELLHEYERWHWHDRDFFLTPLNPPQSTSALLAQVCKEIIGPRLLPLPFSDALRLTVMAVPFACAARDSILLSLWKKNKEELQLQASSNQWDSIKKLTSASFHGKASY